MITFETNGQKNCTEVTAVVDFGTTEPSNEHQFHFTWEADDPHYAYLLAKHFQEELEKHIRLAHKTAYEQGYKDGRGKQKKANWFADWFCGKDNPCGY